jgi:hypothetical protein
MTVPLFKFSRYAVGCYDVTLLAGNDIRIGSVKRMDGRWWAHSPDGNADGPHRTREDAASTLVAAHVRSQE